MAYAASKLEGRALEAYYQGLREVARHHHAARIMLDAARRPALLAPGAHLYSQWP